MGVMIDFSSNLPSPSPTGGCVIINEKPLPLQEGAGGQVTTL
jgi:hypothetical protein